MNLRARASKAAASALPRVHCVPAVHADEESVSGESAVVGSSRHGASAGGHGGHGGHEEEFEFGEVMVHQASLPCCPAA